MKNTIATPIEELNLSVRTYNCLRRRGFRTIGDVIKSDAGELFKHVIKSHKSMEELILSLGDAGFRLAGHEKDEYDNVQDYARKIVSEIVRGNTKRAWNHGMRKTKARFSDDCIIPYGGVSVPGIDPSNDLFCIRSKAEYHLKTHGIHNDALVIFRQTDTWKSGTLTCFRSENGMISFGKEPIEGMRPYGKLAAVINFYDEDMQ